jgi:hypothetical protein
MRDLRGDNRSLFMQPATLFHPELHTGTCRSISPQSTPLAVKKNPKGAANANSYTSADRTPRSSVMRTGETAIFAVLRVQGLNTLTYLRNWALLEKLPIVQLLKKFSAFYGTGRFITVFTRALHWSLSWVRSIQSIPSHPISQDLF